MPHQCTTCGRVFPDGSKEMLSGCPDCGGNKFQFAPAGRSGGTTETATTTAETTANSGSEPSGAVSRAAEAVKGWVSPDDPAEDRAGDRTPSTSDGATQPTDPAAGAPDRTAANAAEARATMDSADSEAAAETSLTDDFPEWPETARSPTDEESTADGDAVVDSGPDVGADERPAAETAAKLDAAPSSTENAAQASARSDVVSTAELPSHTAGSVDGTGEATDASTLPSNGRVVSEPADERPSLDELREELNDQFESIKIVRPGQYELNLMELYDREEYIVSLQEDGRYVIDVPDSWRDGADE